MIGYADFDARTIRVCVDLVANETAKQTGRNFHWVRRRIFDALEFLSRHGPEHPEHEVYFNLAAPVILAAEQLDKTAQVGPLN